MKTIKNMLYIAAMATAITACSGEESLAPEAGTPVTVSVTIPGDVWAVASRVAGEETYSNWKLHYTGLSGNAVYAVGDAKVTVTDAAVSFTTYQAEDNKLVWEQIDATKPMHLTCVTDNGTTNDTTDDYTLHVSVASATPRTDLAFGAMKPTVAKFTVNFTLTTNSTEEVTIGFEAKDKADQYNPLQTNGVWPASNLETAYIVGFGTLHKEQETGSLVRTVTGTILLPEQDMNPILTFGLGSDMPWKVDLSTVSVGNSGQKANQLKTGQHLTLNIKASYTTLNAPSIEVEAFTDGGSYELGGEAQLPSTNS